MAMNDVLTTVSNGIIESGSHDFILNYASGNGLFKTCQLFTLHTSLAMGMYMCHRHNIYCS